jgi:predicted nucleic-acid-binding Zn-ribbon protein
MTYEEYVNHDKFLCLVCGSVILNTKEIMNLHFIKFHNIIDIHKEKYIVELPK